MKHTKKAEQQLLKIVMRNIPPVADRGDLKTRNSDSEDFLTVAVWALKAAMDEAYEFGRLDAQNNAENGGTP